MTSEQVETVTNRETCASPLILNRYQIEENPIRLKPILDGNKLDMNAVIPPREFPVTIITIRSSNPDIKNYYFNCNDVVIATSEYDQQNSCHVIDFDKVTSKSNRLLMNSTLNKQLSRQSVILSRLYNCTLSASSGLFPKVNELEITLFGQEREHKVVLHPNTTFYASIWDTGFKAGDGLFLVFMKEVTDIRDWRSDTSIVKTWVVYDMPTVDDVEHPVEFPVSTRQVFELILTGVRPLYRTTAVFVETSEPRDSIAVMLTYIREYKNE